MTTPLFKIPASVSNDEVIKKMKYFIDEANYAMEFYKADDSHMLQLTKELREELKAEHKNNDLMRVRKHYADHELFSSHYKWAVQEACFSNVGRFDARKAYSFLYDVKDYMEHYLCQIKI